MSTRLAACLLLASALGFTSAGAADKKGTIIVHHHPDPAPAPAPAPVKVDDDLTTYYFALLTKGPNYDSYNKDDRAKIQAMQQRNIERLAGLGKLLVSGPITGSSDWRGIFIFKCASLEEAKELVASDPAVQTGRFTIQVHAWLTQKGSIRDPEFAPPAPAAAPAPAPAPAKP